jgi:methylamine dehydrogenase heavy chain
MRISTRFLCTALCLQPFFAAAARSDLPAEPAGRSLTVPDATGEHWVWVSDQVLRRSALFDADAAQMLGQVNGGQGVSPMSPAVSRARREVYVAETVYSREHRGERTDVLTVYDAITLAVKGEVVIPPKRADNGNGAALTALLGDRFLAVFNQTPANSVSIVDLDARRFVGEIDTGGCALVYAAGPRRFGMLCGDGGALAISLDEAGLEAGRAKTPPFFDPTVDPITEKAAPTNGGWLFASFEGRAYEIDFGAETPAVSEPWDLFTEAEREEGWRIGGLQHLAVHRASGRLFSIVHRGEAGSHKDPGPEVWVYDLAKRERVARYEVPNLTAAFLRPMLGIERGGALEWLLRRAVPDAGADVLAVTQDAAPLLLLGHRNAAAVAVLDARSGEHLRDLEQTGIAGGLLVVP